jgi:Bacterial extracellular solute-binding protein
MPTTPMILLAATLGAVIAVAPATSARGQTADPAKWLQLQKKAKEEGQLVLSGPPFPGLRTALSGAFNQRYGIELNYLGMNAGEVIARVDTESRAGKVSIDANLGGTSTCWAMSQRDEIESMGAKLIDPDILRPAVWKYGKPKLNESGLTPGLRADFNCSFQAAEWVMTDLFANTSIVRSDELVSWRDLLKPQYRGKIAAFDPRRSGPGQTPAGYLAALFGNDYLTELYIGQQVKLTADNRQLAEWVARGAGSIKSAISLRRQKGSLSLGG